MIIKYQNWQVALLTNRLCFQKSGPEGKTDKAPVSPKPFEQKTADEMSPEEKADSNAKARIDKILNVRLINEFTGVEVEAKDPQTGVNKNFRLNYAEGGKIELRSFSISPGKKILDADKKIYDKPVLISCADFLNGKVPDNFKPLVAELLSKETQNKLREKNRLIENPEDIIKQIDYNFDVAWETILKMPDKELTAKITSPGGSFENLFNELFKSNYTANAKLGTSVTGKLSATSPSGITISYNRGNSSSLNVAPAIAFDVKDSKNGYYAKIDAFFEMRLPALYLASKQSKANPPTGKA